MYISYDIIILTINIFNNDHCNQINPSFGLNEVLQLQDYYAFGLLITYLKKITN